MKLLEKRVGFDLKSNYFSYPEAGKFNDLDITNMTIIIFILVDGSGGLNDYYLV